MSMLPRFINSIVSARMVYLGDDQFARHAAQAAMAGKTGVVIGYLHDRFIHVPIELLATQQKRPDPDSPAWSAVLSATAQPHRFE